MKNKTIIEINSTIKGSTGKIMNDIAEEARISNYEVYTCTARHGNEPYLKDSYHVYIGNIIEKRIHLFLALYSGYNGCFSHIGTYLFLKRLNKIKPDLIHIHNLHNGYINLKMLFQYINKKNIPVVWTFHDCWPFTGHCPYFELADCYKWETSCDHCKQFSSYPYGKVDKSNFLFRLKNRLFLIPQIKMIIAPSRWMNLQINKSFFKDKPSRVIYNGVNTEIFKPTESNIRYKYNIYNKKIILSVANVWEERKGLNDLLKLAKDLKNDWFVIIIGGLLPNQKLYSHENLIYINRTYDQIELAKFYTVADVFVNPTMEEVFGLVNVEALCCGTPVITYDTGGSVEILNDECGLAVEKGNYEMLKNKIKQTDFSVFEPEHCRHRGLEFSKDKEIKSYISLYKEVLGDSNE